MSILLIFTGSIFLNALSDAFRYLFDISDGEEKRYGVLYHTANISHILLLICGLIFLNTEINNDFKYLYIIEYIAIRLFLFDIVFNFFTGRNIMYIGETAGTDKFWNLFVNTPNKRTLFFVSKWFVLMATLYLCKDIIL